MGVRGRSAEMGGLGREGGGSVVGDVARQWACWVEKVMGEWWGGWESGGGRSTAMGMLGREGGGSVVGKVGEWWGRWKWSWTLA